MNDRRPMAGPARFVGRERELDVLGAALAAASAVVLIEGEAGIGKTRLLRECLSRSSCDVLVAQCPPFAEPYTLGPVVDAIRGATDSVADLRLSPLAGALRPLFPEWTQELPPAPEPAEDATATRYRTFRALAELIGGLGVTTVVVEDAHWADHATLEFAIFLASRPAPRQNLVVTFRREDLPPDSPVLRLAARPSADSTPVRFELSPLDAAATADMVSSMLGSGPVSAEFAEFVHEHSDGVPLAVEETIRLMAERGDVFRSDIGWLRRQVARIAVPPTIRDAVLERVSRLSAGAVVMLRAAAVLAEPAREATLASLSGLAADRMGDALTEAAGSGLLADEGNAGVSFRHMLARLAVYEAIPGTERRALHLRAGQLLEVVSPPPVARLAWHFHAAGDMVQWRVYAEQAMELGLAAGDEAAAGSLLYELITGSGLPADDLVRLAGKLYLIDWSRPSGYRRIVRALRSMLDNAGLTAAQSAEIRLAIGRLLFTIDEYAEGRAVVEQAVPGLAGNPGGFAAAARLLAWPHGTDWPAPVHLRWLRQASGVAALLEPTDQLRLRMMVATVLLELGKQEGWAAAAQVPKEPVTAEDRQLVMRGHLNIGEVAMRWGRYALARQRLDSALGLADEYQYVRFQAMVQVTLAHLDWFCGAWSGLAARADSLADGEDMQAVSRCEARLTAGLLHAAAGPAALAEEDLQSVLAEARSQAAVLYIAESAAGLGRLRLADGQAGEALAVTEEAMALVVAKRVWLWATDLAPVRVQALIAAGRADEAERLVGVFGRGLRGCDASAPRAALGLCRAMLAESRGEHARAAAAFGRAAAAWRELPRPYDTLLATERQARCLLAYGDDERGLPLLAEVEQGLSELGATGDADRIAHDLRDRGVSVPRAWRGGPRGYGNSLSPRELEVVRHVMAGRTNREIAAALYRSPATVASQLASAMRKLGVTSRTSLAVAIDEAGLIPDDER